MTIDDGRLMGVAVFLWKCRSVSLEMSHCFSGRLSSSVARARRAQRKASHRTSLDHGKYRVVSLGTATAGPCPHYGSPAISIIRRLEQSPAENPLRRSSAAATAPRWQQRTSTATPSVFFGGRLDCISRRLRFQLGQPRSVRTSQSRRQALGLPRNL